MFRYDATGIKMENEFTAAPEGDYRLKIEDVSTEKDGQKRFTKIKEDGSGGYPYVNIKCEIIDENEWRGNTVFHNVTFMPKEKKGAGIAVLFLKTIGEPWEGEFQVNPDDWIGRSFKAHLRVSKDLKGNPKNEIAYLIDEQKSGDEVPF